MSEEQAPEALFQHCVRVYEAMLADGKLVFDHSDDSGDPVEETSIVVWEGFLTTLITSKLNLSVPYYTSITRALKRMGCIRQLKRGGGTAPSLWELCHEPTIELFDESKPLKTKPMDRYSLLQDQLSNHNQRLAVLERALARIIAEEQHG